MDEEGSLTNNPADVEDYRHAAHRRAQEISSRKALDNLTAHKHNLLRPPQLSGVGEGRTMSGGLESNSLEFDLDGSLYGSPPRADEPMSSPTGSGRKVLSKSPSPGTSANSPRARAMTEEEVFQAGLEEYLPKSMSDDGMRLDPRDHLFEAIPAPFEEPTEYQRCIITETSDGADEDTAFACAQLKSCIKLRAKYMSEHPVPPQDLLEPFKTLREAPPTPKKDLPKKDPNDYRRRAVPPYNIWAESLPKRWDKADDVELVMLQGVMRLVPMDQSAAVSCSEEKLATPHQGLDFSSTNVGSYSMAQSSSARVNSLFSAISFDEFLADYMTLRRSVFGGPVSSYAYTRLELLAARYQIHVMLNETRELVAQKSVPHRDFYNVRKVDTHVHHSACMSQKHLLRYIKHKLRFDPHEVVIERDGKKLTLGEVSFIKTKIIACVPSLSLRYFLCFALLCFVLLYYNPNSDTSNDTNTQITLLIIMRGLVGALSPSHTGVHVAPPYCIRLVD